MVATKAVGWNIQNAERNGLSTKNPISSKLILINEGEIRTLPDKQKQWIYCYRSALQEILKGVLQAEMNGH